MTSRFATNFDDGKLDVVRFLRVDKEGVPLQKQVPLTYQVYSGEGDETIVYDGSNCLVIENSLTDGPLTVDFSQMNNYFGRFLHLVIKSVLANNFTMDFAPGSIIIPGVPTPLTSTTTPATFGPASGVINFFAVDQCILIKNALTLPQTILPGNDGDVLTTSAGIVQWLPPAASGSAPNLLSYPILDDPSNELNSSQEVIWDSTGVAVNNTDMTITGGYSFQSVTDSIYDIDVTVFVPGNLNVTLELQLVLNGVTTLARTQSVFGLTGQSLQLSSSYPLTAGQFFTVVCSNVNGPSSGTQPIYPLSTTNGRINIKQFII